MQRLLVAVSSAMVLTGCSETPPTTTAPTPTRASAVVTPNPMTAPTEPGSDLLFNLELRAGRSGTVSIQEGDAQLLDVSGTLVGRTKEFWSQEGGCPVCPSQVVMNAGSAATYTGRRVRFIGGGKPVRFIYTLQFTDDQGPGSTTVEVAVR